MNYKTQKFIRFHHDNPSVYVMFTRFAKEALDAGVPTLSSSLIFERMRWEAYIVTQSTDGFKLSNDFKPYYARLFELMNPCYNGKFKNKKSEADELFQTDIKQPLVQLTFDRTKNL